jgi:hypothetical protein
MVTPSLMKGETMQTFTYCSEEGVTAVVDVLPHKYSMELNRSDMTELVTVLQMGWDNGSEWAGDFLSSIAQTLDIEFI